MQVGGQAVCGGAGDEGQHGAVVDQRQGEHRDRQRQHSAPHNHNTTHVSHGPQTRGSRTKESTKNKSSLENMTIMARGCVRLDWKVRYDADVRGCLGG